MKSLNNIKALREAKGMTQAQLAEAANIHRVTIARYETTDNGMTVDSAYRIAEALGCTVDDLIEKESQQDVLSTESEA